MHARMKTAMERASMTRATKTTVAIIVLGDLGVVIKKGTVLVPIEYGN
jgi:hypothetical protein